MFYAHEQDIVIRVTFFSHTNHFWLLCWPSIAIARRPTKKASCIIGIRTGVTTGVMTPLLFHKHSAHVDLPTRSLTDRECSRTMYANRAARYFSRFSCCILALLADGSICSLVPRPFFAGEPGIHTVCACVLNLCKISVKYFGSWTTWEYGRCILRGLY